MKTYQILMSFMLLSVTSLHASDGFESAFKKQIEAKKNTKNQEDTKIPQPEKERTPLEVVNDTIKTMTDAGISHEDSFAILRFSAGLTPVLPNPTKKKS